jgi:hypothetical protein
VQRRRTSLPSFPSALSIQTSAESKTLDQSRRGDSMHAKPRSVRGPDSGGLDVMAGTQDGPQDCQSENRNISEEGGKSGSTGSDRQGI